MRTILVILVAAAIAFAGCTSTESDGGDGTSSTSTTSGSSTGSSTNSGSGTSSSSGTGTSSPPANAAPTAGLSASTPGGTLPLLVEFNLTGADSDGDALSWDLSFGDGQASNGTLLPATVAHNFTAAGLYNVTLNVTDGQHLVHAFVIVNVTSAPEGATAGQVANLVWDVGYSDATVATAPGPGLTCEDDPTATWNYDSFTLDAATVGLPFKATISDFTGGAAIVGWTLYFNLADCSDFAGTFSADGDGEITGTIPADAGPYVFALATGGFLLEVEYRSGSQIL